MRNSIQILNDTRIVPYHLLPVNDLILIWFAFKYSPWTFIQVMYNSSIKSYKTSIKEKALWNYQELTKTDNNYT
jgi:hypothetical protein